jgi:hypothetical protein
VTTDRFDVWLQLTERRPCEALPNPILFESPVKKNALGANERPASISRASPFAFDNQLAITDKSLHLPVDRLS